MVHAEERGGGDSSNPVDPVLPLWHPLQARIVGPEGTIYGGGVFKLQITVRAPPSPGLPCLGNPYLTDTDTDPTPLSDTRQGSRQTKPTQCCDKSRGQSLAREVESVESVESAARSI